MFKIGDIVIVRNEYKCYHLHGKYRVTHTTEDNNGKYIYIAGLEGQPVTGNKCTYKFKLYKNSNKENY